MQGKHLALMLAMEGQESNGLRELIGFNPPEFTPSPEEQREIDNAFFAFHEQRALQAKKT